MTFSDKLHISEVQIKKPEDAGDRRKVEIIDRPEIGMSVERKSSSKERIVGSKRESEEK